MPYVAGTWSLLRTSLQRCIVEILQGCTTLSCSMDRPKGANAVKRNRSRNFHSQDTCRRTQGHATLPRQADMNAAAAVSMKERPRSAVETDVQSIDAYIPHAHPVPDPMCERRGKGREGEIARTQKYKARKQGSVGPSRRHGATYASFEEPTAGRRETLQACLPASQPQRNANQTPVKNTTTGTRYPESKELQSTERMCALQAQKNTTN